MDFFVDSVIKKVDVSPEKATHFAIYRGDKVRYYISLSKGNEKQAKKRLVSNVSAYSGKLEVLMKLLWIIPYRILQLIHIGRFVKLEIRPSVLEAMIEVQECILKCQSLSFNVIVGSYVEKQKVVFQCFSERQEQAAIFIKVGGSNSTTEMLTEIAYLESPIKTESFLNPLFYFSKKQCDGNEYNIQVTKEFTGEKVEPQMTPDIYGIFQEIAASKVITVENGVLQAFSHGDFTPWNMKKSNGKYIVFDWEYCGMRFYGFDLIHYLWQVENKLNGKDNETAMKKALKTAKSYDNELRKIDDKILKNMYITELKRQFGNKL